MSATGSGCTTGTSPATASVAVVAQPSLSNPTPATQTVCNNAAIAPINSTLSNGTGTISYQWYSNTSNSTTGGTSLGSANGAQTNSYTPPASTTAGTTYYYLVAGVSGSGCNTATTAATAAVTVNPVVGTFGSISPTTAQTLCTGNAPVGPFVASGATGGSGTFTYQWYYQANNTAANPGGGTSTSGWTSLGSSNGANTASYTPTVITNNTSYACFVTPGCGTPTWANGVINVTVITTGPQAIATGAAPMCIGGSETLSVSIVPSISATYQWRVSTDNSSFTNVTSGGTGTTYSPPSTAIGTLYYDVVATFTGSGCSPATSNSETVAVDSQLITGNPSPATQTVCAGTGGSAAAITLTPTGGAGTVSYQWYSNTTNSTSGGTLISGATSASYSPPYGTGGTTYYYAVATVGGSGCTSPVTTLSDAAVKVSLLSVVAGDNSGGNAYCASGTIGLTATASPAGSYTYSWSSSPAGFTSSSANPSLPASNWQGQSPVFTVSVTDGTCTATASVSESVYPTITLTAALANCSFIDSAHLNVSVDSNMVIVTANGGVAPYTFGTPPAGSFLRDVIINHRKNMYTIPSNNGLYNYTITDQVGCTATSNTVQSLNGNPINIPYTVVNGSETLTCYDNAYGKWLTFNDTLNNAVLEMYDSSQNLGQVSVTIYKDKTSMHIQESGYGCGLGSTYESPLQRHFVLHSTAAQPFSNQVKLRLYFSDAELDSIERAEADNYNGTLCSQLGAVNSLGDLYVTKYDDPRTNTPTEDSLYTNNLSGAAGGIYKVYGTAGPYAAYVVGGLQKDSLGFNKIYPGSQANHIHYVQLSVTEFSELWLNGAQYYNEPLPVNMLYLQAQAIDNSYIQVSWATAQEINNNHFTIERSIDSQNWDSIGIVLGHGTTTVESDYTFNDNDVAANVRYYYRLKQVDDNGNFTYTEIVTAEIVGQATFNIKGFIPNPTTGSTSLIITTSKTLDVSVQLFDILGQDVTSAQSHHLAVGANQLDFDFRSLAAGTYTAVLTSGNEVYTKRLVITK
jgi:Secretion system C-terminal sorting domain